jgi:hypothetical protein
MVLLAKHKPLCLILHESVELGEFISGNFRKAVTGIPANVYKVKNAFPHGSSRSEKRSTAAKRRLSGKNGTQFADMSAERTKWNKEIRKRNERCRKIPNFRPFKCLRQTPFGYPRGSDGNSIDHGATHACHDYGSPDQPEYCASHYHAGLNVHPAAGTIFSIPITPPPQRRPSGTTGNQKPFDAVSKAHSRKG